MYNFKDLDLRNIIINSCGPYVHSYFEIDNQYFSHEGPLAGRANFLIQNTESFLESYCQRNDLKKENLKILDVGCYDGWILNKLYYKGYKTLYGLEPRLQNIERGKILRKTLNISDDVKHFQGTLVDQGLIAEQNDFDIVLNFGVIHHLNDIHSFINLLRTKLKTGGALLVETLTLDDSFADKNLSTSLEPKDIIYNDTSKAVSFIGVKLESDYYPGSAAKTGTVQIPAKKALLWFLENSNFKILRDFTQKTYTAHREAAQSTFIESLAVDSNNYKTNRYSSILERKMVYGVLDEITLEHLEKVVGENPEPFDETLKQELDKLIISISTEEHEIVKSIIHAPVTKLQFEKAKYYFLNNESTKAINILHELVTQLSDDWRTTYRSFYLLKIIDPENFEFWKEMANRCNPEFPEEIIDAKPYNL